MSPLSTWIIIASIFLSPALFGSDPQGEPRVINLTAVSSDGVWTLQEVNNVNYWRSPKKTGSSHESHGSHEIFERNFTPATIVTRRGEVVLLRLRSFDVMHGFYIPEIGIGPFDIEKGVIKEVVIDTKKYQPGVYSYYCMNERCTDLHFWMRGHFIIYPEDGKFDEPKEIIDWNSKAIIPSKDEFFNMPPEPSLERGRTLFRVKGCVTCHNQAGTGGIENFNYLRGKDPALDDDIEEEPVGGTVPQLNNRADKMMIYEAEKGRKVIDILSRGSDISLDELNEIGIETPAVTLAQYRNMKKLIKTGKKDVGKKNPDGPTPPLYMPSWKNELSDQDINTLLAYLLSISEYDDGEIEVPKIKRATMEIPETYEAALSLFGSPEDIRFMDKAGNSLTFAIAALDLIIIVPFLLFYFRSKKRNKGA